MFILKAVQHHHPSLTLAMLSNKSSRTHFVVHTSLNDCRINEPASWQSNDSGQADVPETKTPSSQIGLTLKALQRKTKRLKSDRRKHTIGSTEYALLWYGQMIYSSMVQHRRLTIKSLAGLSDTSCSYVGEVHSGQGRKIKQLWQLIQRPAHLQQTQPATLLTRGQPNSGLAYPLDDIRDVVWSKFLVVKYLEVHDIYAYPLHMVLLSLAWPNTYTGCVHVCLW